MLILVASLIILVPLILLTILNMPASRGMAISSATVILSAALIWGVKWDAIGASAVQGIVKTIEVLWILAGALILLNVLSFSKGVIRITQGFKNITADMRLQAVIIAWLFGGLIEGVSGFGTPAIVAAPLLIALGYSPIAAVALALIGNSTSSIFGAVSTPMNVGFSNLPLSGSDLHQVGVSATMTDFFAGSFIPTVIVFVAVMVFGRNKSIKQFFNVLPWALMIGFFYTGSAFLFANLFGGNFVSILAPIVTIAFAILTTKIGLLVPKKPWVGAQHITDTVEESFNNEETGLTLIQAWAPYIIVVVLLFITGLVPQVADFAKEFSFSINHIFGYKEINASWEFLNSPGTILLIAAIAAIFIQKQDFRVFAKSASVASKSIFGSTGFTLLVTLIMVQVFSNSGINTHDLVSMPHMIADAMAKSLSGVWLLIAPFLGMIGSFITGSSTVSALTFSPIQFGVAESGHLYVPLVLGLQLIGGAAGNMVAIHNVVSVSAVVGLRGKEGKVLRTVILPAFLYVILAGIGATILVSLGALK